MARTRRLRCRAAVPALVALAAAAGSTPTAVAADPELRALSDTRKVASTSEAVVVLRAMRPGVCPRGGAGSARPMSTRKAIGRAEGLLRKRVPRKGYKRFTRSRRAKKPAVAEDLAASAVAAGTPAAALAGFLAAHEREPRNPRHLLNASTVLTRLGKPREALALVAAAERLPRPDRMPMGIGVAPLALNARGFALIALRRYSQAEQPLRRAAQMEPLLAEANLNLAAARLCGGRLNAAVAPYVAGQRRRAMAGGVDVAAVQPAAGAALDLSAGRGAELPKTPLPPTPDDGVASAAGWKASQEQRYAEAEDLVSQATTALVSMSDGLVSKHPLQAARTLQVLDIFNERYSQRPALKTKKDAILATAPRMAEIYLAWQQEYQQLRSDCQEGNRTSDEIEACIRARCQPATVNAHSRWLEVMKEAEQLTREWADELYRYSSGLAANYSSAEPMRAITLAARHEIMAIYASHVVLQIASWTGSEDTLKDECTNSGGTAAGEEGAPEYPFPDLCPPALASIKFAFSVGFASFGVNCEAVSVEVSLPKPISPFVSVSYGFASGTTSVFAGAKGGGKLIPGVSGGVKAGVTFTFDSSGKMTDVGVRGQAGASGPGLPNLPGTAPKIGGQLDYSLADAFL